MIDFPIADLLDDGICLIWLERYLYPNGLRCFHGGHTERRLCRPPPHVRASRWRTCDGSSMLRTAIRRGIITRSEDLLFANTWGIDDYSRDELCQVLFSIMRRGRQYDRGEIPALVAKHLGFSRVTDNVRTCVRSAITTAIRRGDLVSDRSGVLYRMRT